MGLPSGVMWSPVNIDVERPGGFARSPFQYDCSFFSWGNVDGHNPTGPSSFSPWDWGSVNAEEPWYDGQVYGDTPGDTLTSNIPVGEEFDAARANLGPPWRMPTSEEFRELFANIIYIDANGQEIDTSKTNKLVNVNGVFGLYLQSKINGARLFFSCSGYGNGATRNYRSSWGLYWSSSMENSRNSYNLLFNSGIISAQSSYYGYRYHGFTIRPVMTL